MKKQKESNFKLNVETLYSKIMKDNCRILVTGNNISSKKEMSSILDRRRSILNAKSSMTGSKKNNIKK